MTFLEGIEAAESPGSKERGEGHFSGRAGEWLSATANLAAGDQVPQTAFGRTVGRWDLRIADKHEEFLLVFVNARTQVGLDGEGVGEERPTLAASILISTPQEPGATHGEGTLIVTPGLGLD